MGNWEMGAQVMRDWGWPISAVYQPYQNKKFKELIQKRRARGGNFIPIGQNAAANVRKALRKGDIVAMLGDHPFGEDGIQVQLLGQTVRWPKGPIVLAASEKIPIVIGVGIRTGPDSFNVTFEDPLFVENRSKSGIQKTTQDVANIFGKFLVRYPSQWFRFQQFEFSEKPFHGNQSALKITQQASENKTLTPAG